MGGLGGRAVRPASLRVPLVRTRDCGDGMVDAWCDSCPIAFLHITQDQAAKWRERHRCSILSLAYSNSGGLYSGGRAAGD